MKGLFSFCLGYKTSLPKTKQKTKTHCSEAPELLLWASMVFSALQILLSSLEFWDYEDETQWWTQKEKKFWF